MNARSQRLCTWAGPLFAVVVSTVMTFRAISEQERVQRLDRVPNLI